MSPGNKRDMVICGAGWPGLTGAPRARAFSLAHPKLLAFDPFMLSNTSSIWISCCLSQRVSVLMQQRMVNCGLFTCFLLAAWASWCQFSWKLLNKTLKLWLPAWQSFAIPGFGTGALDSSLPAHQCSLCLHSTHFHATHATLLGTALERGAAGAIVVKTGAQVGREGGVLNYCIAHSKAFCVHEKMQIWMPNAFVDLK